MSLINKMLVDLEARRDAPTDVPVKPIFDDLRPTMGGAPSRRVQPMAVIGLALALGVGGFFAWRHWLVAAPATLVAVTKPAPVRVLPQPTAAVVAPSPVPEIVPAPIAPALPAAAPAPTVTATPASPARTIAAAPVAESVKAPPTVKPELPRVSKPKAEPVKPKTESAALTPEQEPALIDKKAHVQTPQQKAENLYRAALAQLKQRQLAQAEPNLRAALTEYPAHTKAREMLAGLLLETARWSEATQVLTQGQETLPEHYPFAQLLARIYVEHGMEAKALATLESAQSHAARDADYRGFLATLYQRAGRHAEAANSYRDALVLRPYEAKWWLGMGISLEAERQWAAAEEAYTRAQQGSELTPALKRYIDERLQIVKARK